MKFFPKCNQLIKKIDKTLKTLETKGKTSKYYVVISNGFKISNEHFVYGLMNALGCDDSEAVHLLFQVLNFGRKNIFFSNKNTCAAMAQKLNGVQVMAQVLSNQVYDEQQMAIMDLEQLVAFELRKKLSDISECKSILNDNRIRKIIHSVKVGWKQVNSVLNSALFVCSLRYPNEILQELLRNFDVVSESDCHVALLENIVNHMVKIQHNTGQRILIKIFDGGNKYTSQFLKIAYLIMTKLNSIDYLVFQKYLEILKIFRGVFCGSEITYCSAQIFLSFKNSIEAKNLVEKAMWECKDVEISDHVFHLAYLFGNYPLTYNISLERLVKSVELQHCEKFIDDIIWYNAQDTISLSYLDKRFLLSVLKSEGDFVLERILQRIPFKEPIVCFFLNLIAQFAYNSANYTCEQNIINELAKGAKSKDELREFVLEHKFDEVVSKVADLSSKNYVLKTSMKSKVSPFYSSNTTCEKRDEVLKFCVEHKLKVFPDKTPLILQSEFLITYLKQVCKKTKIHSSVFALLCSLPAEKTKEFISYANDHYFCQFFLNKI